jgi:hypothetical protein
VSFATVAITVDSQFGVIWPVPFTISLDILSVLAFDLSAFSSLLCMVKVTFYGDLLVSTIGILIVELAILFIWPAWQRRNSRDLFGDWRLDEITTVARKQYFAVAVYTLVFLYPVLSVKLLRAFGCHEVNGVHYLKADYSVECSSSKWQWYRAYASVWLFFYVILFPAYLFYKLWYKYPTVLGLNGDLEIRKNGKPKPLRDVSLYFLIEDYRCMSPAMTWEAVEMVRKLFLCTVGAIFAKKSVICVSTAFFLSLAFSFAHFHYYPYKSMACNRLQSACLTALNIIYFVGVLLKAEVVEQHDMDYLGYFLVRYPPFHLIVFPLSAACTRTHTRTHSLVHAL